jgi:hypothetical protein
MHRLLLSLAALLSLFGCSALPREQIAPLRGRLELSVEPNPIVAHPLGGDLYELTFDIIMREAGGVGVRVEDFTVDTVAFKSVVVRSQTFPATFITDRGFPASIEAGKYLRFRFSKRWTLPAGLLLSGASARVEARTVDDNGIRGKSSVRIAVVVADR